MNIFALFVILAMLATLVAFGLGIISMVRGGEFDQTHSTQYMGWRVGLQGLTFVLLLIALYAAYA